MEGCKCENWKLSDLSMAIKNNHKDNKTIIVPMFQRRECWKPKKELEFIDSLKKGFPVGTMLFYKTVDGEREVYTLIDGLQRSNTIKKYMENPTKYLDSKDVPECVLSELHTVLGYDSTQDFAGLIIEYLAGLSSLRGIQYYSIAKAITEKYPPTDNAEAESFEKLMVVIEPYIKKIQNEYDDIASIEIPVLVYSGDVNNLPEIFKRINSKGIPLDNYEVYAAAWPINSRFFVKNEDIVNRVMKKYDTLIDHGFIVDGYDAEKIRRGKMLNSFEYLFGLSRYLNDKYDILRFDNTSAEDEINTMSFELTNACFNDSPDKIAALYNVLLQIEDINYFEECLESSIQFVGKVIAEVNKFKGSRRIRTSPLHGKYQIMSMIAAVFREKYCFTDPSLSDKAGWKSRKVLLEKGLLQNYVYDIITKEWRDGGTTKIFKVIKEEKYLTEISYEIWDSTLNKYYEESNLNKSVSQVKNPSKEDIVFLNCIYLPIFSARDQLSGITFDIEHLATKGLMKKAITESNGEGEGLPIASIANICYLNEGTNRGKKDATIYQFEKIKGEIPEIEKKYSFTVHDDLKWLEKSYGKNDFYKLKQDYLKFLNKRFKTQKDKFYESMKIEKPEGLQDKKDTDNANMENVTGRMYSKKPPLPDTGLKVGQFIKTAMTRLSFSEYEFSEDQLALMCTKEWSRETFGVRVWLPMIVPADKEFRRRRYYKEPFIFNGNSYYLYSQWEINSDMKERFIKWYNTL